jgi:hypothetical protein
MTEHDGEYIKKIETWVVFIEYGNNKYYCSSLPVKNIDLGLKIYPNFIIFAMNFGDK